MSKQELKQKGFTIIEVVLVLAIAALIFLMVFIALPALQRSQRDTQRKDDLSRVQTAITNYQGNNRNKLPATDDWNDTFTTNYLKAGSDSFTDPSGKDYTFTADSDPTKTPNVRDMTDAGQANVRIFYAVGYTCDGESLTGGQGTRKIALRMVLEGGGVSCISN